MNIRNLCAILNDLLIIHKSPLKLPKLSFYWGDILIGTPIFLPRKWVKKKGSNSLYATPRKLGVDIWVLGWKTKWTETDFRYEWSPGISFVILKKQFVIGFDVSHMANKDSIAIDDAYWETFLHWKLNTNKKLKNEDRLNELKTKHSNKWHGKDGEIDYYDLILK